MNLDSYLQRISYYGALDTSLPTLYAIHHAHLTTLTYENLDIHLGRSLLLNVNHSYRKIVEEGRGGWCYEMNGVLAWALQALGFNITLLGAAVNRARLGDLAQGNHLMLLATVEDKHYVLDAGFGNGILEPMPLQAGEITQGWMQHELLYDGERWHYQNNSFNQVTFDFTLQPHHYEDFEEQCHWLQTSVESGFVRRSVCQRYIKDGTLLELRDATYREYRDSGTMEQVVTAAEDYKHLLHNQFALNLSEDEAMRLWRGVSE